MHTDQGTQCFQSDEFNLFCKQHKIKRSITTVPKGKQVIKRIHAVIKSNIRLRVDPEAQGLKLGSWAYPIRKLLYKPKEEILDILKFAIEVHINNISSYNQQMSPHEFDTALATTKEPHPIVMIAHNDQSEDAKEIESYRDQVTVEHFATGPNTLRTGNRIKTKSSNMQSKKELPFINRIRS